MTALKLSTKRIKLATFVLIAAISFFLAHSVSAQQPEGALNLTVSPPVYDLTAEPGDLIRETFRVRNNGNTPLKLNVTARRLVSDPNSGNPIPEAESKGEELSWVTFEPSSFTAPPREWSNITFTINVPESAAYGYYFVFGIAPQSAGEQETTGAGIEGEVLVVTLLNVKKDGAIAKAELVKFAPRNFVTEHLPVTFDTIVANRGNVHVKPNGNIFITRGSGREVAILDVNQGVGSVLPEGRRTFESSWNEGFLVREPILEDGQPKIGSNGQPETKIVINWNKLTDFRIGPYTARLLLIYDDGTRDQTIEGTTTFWVIPYTAIIVILVGLVALYFIIRTLLRSYVKSQIRKSR